MGVVVVHMEDKTTDTTTTIRMVTTTNTPPVILVSEEITQATTIINKVNPLVVTMEATVVDMVRIRDKVDGTAEEETDTNHIELDRCAQLARTIRYLDSGFITSLGKQEFSSWIYGTPFVGSC